MESVCKRGYKKQAGRQYVSYVPYKVLYGTKQTQQGDWYTKEGSAVQFGKRKVRLVM